MSLFFIFLFFCYFGAMICWVDGKVGGMERNYGFEDRLY